MKKIALSMTALAVVLAVTFTSCKKDDTSNPVVSVTGSGTTTIDLGTVWVDPGATATDDIDGSITPTATGTVDVDKVGEYTITYKAIDKAGNEGTATRTVKVKSDLLAKSYAVVEHYEDATTSGYTQAVAVSSTGYNKLVFNGFGNYGTNASVDVTVTSTGFTGAEKTLVLQDGGGVQYNCRLYNISGTYAKAGSLYNILTATYKLDATPVAGGTTQTTTTTQNYTVQ
ncbi:MAG: DUF5011 domain-containing protein [Bacteroidota bacterium]